MSLARSRLVQSTFVSHCPLTSNQSKSEIFFQNAENQTWCCCERSENATSVHRSPPGFQLLCLQASNEQKHNQEMLPQLSDLTNVAVSRFVGAWRSKFFAFFCWNEKKTSLGFFSSFTFVTKNFLERFFAFKIVSNLFFSQCPFYFPKKQSTFNYCSGY